MKLSLQSKLLVTFTNFGQVTQVVLGKLKLSGHCHFSNFEQVTIVIFTNFGQFMHLLQIIGKQDCFISLFLNKYHLN